MYLKPHLVLPLDEAGNGDAKQFKLKGLKEGWVIAQRKWTSVTKDTGVGNPKEYLVNMSYSRKISPKNVLGISLKPFYSNLTNGINSAFNNKPIASICGDIGWNYENPIEINDKLIVIHQIGAAINNFGPKVSSSEFDPRHFRSGMAGGKERMCY